MEKDFDRWNGEKKKRALNVWHRSEDTCLLLDAMPSVGPALATALVATVADPKAFRPGRISPPGLGSCSSTDWCVNANSERIRDRVLC